ncbi:amidohydrolase, partial [Escherichia coli]|nr:amidohydrolase [Escherichia coli]
EAEFGGTVRTHDKQVRAQLEQRAREAVVNIAAASGATATFSWHPGPPVLENDAHWAQFASQVAQQVGYQVQQAELH